MRPRRIIAFSLGAVFAVATIGIAHGAATTAVEAGIYRDYVAPDPGLAILGSITFGFTGSPETIAIDAVLTSPADSNLPSLSGAPTCLAVTRDGGVITALAFVGSCTVSGTVLLVEDAFGPGGDAYITGDRVAAPADLVETNPGIRALMLTAADSGNLLTINFTIDPATGAPTAFTAATSVAGAVTVQADGDVQVGSAVLPKEVIDEDAQARFDEAAAREVEVTVAIEGIGVLDTSSGVPNVTIALSVVLPAAPSPAPAGRSPSLAPMSDTSTAGSP